MPLYRVQPRFVITAELHVNPGILNTGNTRKMSSANASMINIVDNPKGKAVAWNYYGFVKRKG